MATAKTTTTKTAAAKPAAKSTTTTNAPAKSANASGHVADNIQGLARRNRVWPD